ncbi:MAG: site-specific integrase [Dehalobacter sp.]|nr:site-specific integrase [Dehalobacter sp.]
MAKKSKTEKGEKPRRPRGANGEGGITQLKNGLWQARISRREPDGRLKRIAFYGKTRQEVHEKLVKALREVQTGSFIDPNKDSFGEWLNTWLSKYKKTKISDSTFALYQYVAEKHILPSIEKTPLQKLETKHVQNILNNMQEAGKSSRLIHLAHQVINGALKQAVREQKIYRNVCDATELPKLTYKEIKPLSKDQVKKFLEAAKANKRTKKHYPAFILELSTGLRRGELLALRWKDIDLDKGILQVRQSLNRVVKESGGKKTQLMFSEPKTKKSQRVIKVPAHAMTELKAHQLATGNRDKPEALIFASKEGKPIDPRSFTKMYERLLIKAELPKTSFHALRHTVAVLLLQAGEKPKNIQDLLGHEKYSTTMDIYASYVPDDEKEKTAENLNSILEEVM